MSAIKTRNSMEAKENLKEAISNISQGTLRVLHCPHFISIGGFQHGCMLGKFPCDCQSCDCPDKKYVDMNYTSTFANTINTEKDMKEKELEEVIICACGDVEHLEHKRAEESDTPWKNWSSSRKWLKRSINRLMRRNNKSIDPDEQGMKTNRKPTKGWEW